MVLSQGSPAPPFRAPDQDGNERTSAELAGQRFVLYFYPHDDTMICTRQACGFQDNLDAFQALGVPVIGVSPNGVGSHKAFAKKHGLRFTLLSDKDRKIIDAYDVRALLGRTARVTYIIGPDMRIEAVHRAELTGAGHAKWARETLMATAEAQ